MSKRLALFTVVTFTVILLCMLYSSLAYAQQLAMRIQVEAFDDRDNDDAIDFEEYGVSDLTVTVTVSETGQVYTGTSDVNGIVEFFPMPARYTYHINVERSCDPTKTMNYDRDGAHGFLYVAFGIPTTCYYLPIIDQ